MGNKWKRISERFEGRGDSAIKNQFFSLVRRGLRIADKLLDGSTGTGGNAPQATRLLTLKGGDGKATIEEALNKYSAENMSYM